MGSGQQVSTALWSCWERGSTSVPPVVPGDPGTVGEGCGPPASSAPYPVSAQRCIEEASPGSLSSGVKGSGLLWWPGRQMASPWQVSLTPEAHPLVPGSSQGLQLSVLHSRTSALLGSGSVWVYLSPRPYCSNSDVPSVEHLFTQTLPPPTHTHTSLSSFLHRAWHVDVQ